MKKQLKQKKEFFLDSHKKIYFYIEIFQSIIFYPINFRIYPALFFSLSSFLILKIKKIIKK
jgi:hypothetical protein